MGISSDDFYDTTQVALVPMGFCYPGTGLNGDLPPRKECAELWHDQLLAMLSNIQLTLAIGRYAQDYRLGKQVKRTLTETVKNWKEFSPDVLPLPHPSPRNNRWLKTNSWFVADVVPWLQRRVSGLLVGK